MRKKNVMFVIKVAVIVIIIIAILMMTIIVIFVISGNGDNYRIVTIMIK
jgi:hypothetical protein